jgi:hypothetical protein
MTNHPLDAMMARWNHIRGSLFPWLREEVDRITEVLGRIVTLDVIGLEAFVPEPPRPRTPARGSPRPRQGLRRQGNAGRSRALIERLAVDRSLRRILGWALASALGGTFSRAFAEFARGDLPDKMQSGWRFVPHREGPRAIPTIAVRAASHADPHRHVLTKAAACLKFAHKRTNN